MSVVYGLDVSRFFNVAFVVSVLGLAIGVGAVIAIGRRRQPGQVLTWGEALVAATFVFFLMFLAYGVVPHQWLAWADNELRWRSDKILVGPGGVLEDYLPFTLTYLVLRDLIVVGIYGAMIGLQIFLWSWWQARGRAKPVEIETSSYGRPLVKRG
ncbi:MAG TPA: hypothetical protein VGB14_17605 [Acidimicrobiales bacterium]